MDESKFWLGLWSVVSISLVSLIIGILYINHLNEKQFIEGGFTRETLPGQSMTQWVKK